MFGLESVEFDTKCLYCGHLHEVHTGLDGTKPRPNDVSVCFNCGYTARYDDNLQLAPLTSEQQKDLENNPKFKAIMAGLRLIKDRISD